MATTEFGIQAQCATSSALHGVFYSLGVQPSPTRAWSLPELGVHQRLASIRVRRRTTTCTISMCLFFKLNFENNCGLCVKLIYNLLKTSSNVQNYVYKYKIKLERPFFSQDYYYFIISLPGVLLLKCLYFFLLTHWCAFIEVFSDERWQLVSSSCLLYFKVSTINTTRLKSICLVIYHFLMFKWLLWAFFLSILWTIKHKLYENQLKFNIVDSYYKIYFEPTHSRPHGKEVVQPERSSCNWIFMMYS